MYLYELKLWNFRKYGTGKGDNGDISLSFPGLNIRFQKGVNVIIGENDSGKTAIIDAIRYVLHTKSGEHIVIDEKDFYKPSNGIRTSAMRIECVFKGLSANDAGLFLEWLSVEKNDDGKINQILRLTLTATRDDKGGIKVKISAGDGNESNILPYEVRELLSAVYLKPLRDASQDMTHGHKSRLAQILQAHSIFGKDEKDSDGKHQLESDYDNLKKSIDNYFNDDNQKGNKITTTLNNIIVEHFLLANDDKKAVIRLTGSELSDILRQLDLILEENKSGLGTLNLLCMAAELLLLEEQTRGLKLTLIEELEAHIHPQLQLRLIDYFENEAKYAQFILTTHSTTLGATIPLQKLIIMKGDKAFSMDADSTMCTEDDYNFLHRFLDATKANLFFARGLLLVEGDAENLLIPAIARIIDRDLHKYGVSIVNVGSRAYKRYVNIFKRKDGFSFGMPISIVADLDVKGADASNNTTNDDREQKRKDLQCINSDEIKIFTTKCWTLEYDIARSDLYKELALAIELAKKEMHGKDIDAKVIEKEKAVIDEKYKGEPNDKIACEIFSPLNNGHVSKAITAQYFAKLLEEKKGKVKAIIEKDEYFKYIVDAIKHVTED